MNALIFVNWGFIVVDYNVCGTKVKDNGKMQTCTTGFYDLSWKSSSIEAIKLTVNSQLTSIMPLTLTVVSPLSSIGPQSISLWNKTSTSGRELCQGNSLI